MKPAEYNPLTDIAFFFAIILLIMNFFSYKINAEVIEQIRLSSAKQSSNEDNFSGAGMVKISVNQNNDITIDENPSNLENLLSDLPYADSYSLYMDRQMEVETFIKIHQICKAKNQFAIISMATIKEE